MNGRWVRLKMKVWRVSNIRYLIVIIDYIRLGREAELEYMKVFDKELYTFSKRLDDCDLYYSSKESTLVNYRAEKVMEDCKIETILENMHNESKWRAWQG